jgi:hypothetical protein
MVALVGVDSNRLPGAGERTENHNIMKNKRKEGPCAWFFSPVTVVDLSAHLRYTAEL